jgi:hypothetical protein
MRIRGIAQVCLSRSESIPALGVRFLHSTSRAFADTALGWLLDVLSRPRRLTAVSAYYDGRCSTGSKNRSRRSFACGGAARIVVGSNRGVTVPKTSNDFSEYSSLACPEQTRRRVLRGRSVSS